MAQVAQASVIVSFKDCKLEYSTDGAAYTDMSGYGTTVDVGGGERNSGEAYTFDGDTAILGFGKRAPLEITITLVYTENASHPYQAMRSYFENATDFYLRWSPLGGDAGEWQWTTTLGKLTACPPPMGEAASADPLVAEAVFRCANVAKTNVAS